jgi:hypothetical protein
MPTTIKANAGDTLCGLAISAGFLDCAPLRDANPGAAFLNRACLLKDEEVIIPDLVEKVESKPTEKKHTFKLLSAPPVLVRFTHGSPDKPYRQDPDMTQFHISNFPTNKGGLKADKDFPTATKFDQRGHDDIDAFKVEVVDPSAPSKVEVLLEARKPVLVSGKPIVVGGVRQTEPFPAAELAKRQQKVELEAVPSKVCYRSPYIRLVVDDHDKAGGPGRPFEKQTLLVADLSDLPGADNEAVEILDQVVRASYTRPSCPAATKCTVTCEAPVGEDRLRVKLAFHILKDPTSGAPLSNDAQLRRTCCKFLRTIYAQADMSFKILGTAREVVIPQNMVVVDNERGRAATGGGEVKVRIRIDGTFDQVVTITTAAGDSCAATAAKIADAIRAVVPAGITVRDLPNPPIFGRTTGSADVLVGDPLANDIRVTVEASGDTVQQVQAAIIATAGFDTGSGNERHVGNINSRLILKNYDTGRDRIDVFVTGPLDGGGVLGLAFNPFRKYTTKYGHPAANDDIANSFFVSPNVLHQVGVAPVRYRTFAHEIGHVLMDAIHTTERPIELMVAGPSVVVPTHEVGGAKRLSDRIDVRFDEQIKGIPVRMLRENNTEVLTGWDDI